MLNDEISTPSMAPARRVVPPPQPEVYDALGTPTGNQQRKDRDESINGYLRAAIEEHRRSGRPWASDPLYSPLDRDGRISTTYGNRIHPVTGKPGGHPALDITTNNKENVSVTAMRAGTVIYRGYFGPDAGNAIMVLDDNGEIDFYAHLATGMSMHIRPGERIRAGQIIGIMGMTGKATERHIHVTLRKLPPTALLESARAQAEALPGFVAPVILDANTGLPLPFTPVADPALDYTKYENTYPSINGLTYAKDDPVAGSPLPVRMAGNPLPKLEDYFPTAKADPATALPSVDGVVLPTSSNIPAGNVNPMGKGQAVLPFKR